MSYVRYSCDIVVCLAGGVFGFDGFPTINFRVSAQTCMQEEELICVSVTRHERNHVC